MVVNEFLDAFIRHKLERKAKNFLTDFCKGFSVDDLEYAVANNLDVMAGLLKAGGRKSRQVAVIPFRSVLGGVTGEDLLRICSEVSPRHGAVLRRHPDWTERQIALIRKDILG